MRPKTTPRRCDKCMEFGHIALNCKSGEDFTKSCYNCAGSPGQRLQNPANVHQTASSRCPLYKKEIQQVKDR
ncbi:uncharacterized protein DMAD_11121 [Drosophila madeirensis]|uniref:CCHC-type domain-containing protein n=1 Tax=Drosophila madeirensis TaxID=30013 RepID=A0AAU9FC45_DROMD